MRYRPLLIAAAALASQTACDSQQANEAATGAGGNMAMTGDNMAAVPPNETAPAAAVNVPSTADYVANAALSDMYEIESSTLARDKARAPELKAFADRIITDHTATTKSLKAALAQGDMGITPPAALDDRRRGLVQALKAAGPDAFDDLYHQQQIAAHEEALALHQGYAAGGENAALRRVAGTATPIVQSHLTMLRQMER